MTFKRNPATLVDTAVVRKKDVAPTRLQLRWAEDEESPGRYICHYELVLALDQHDIRRERHGPRGGRRPDAVCQIVPMGRTSRGANVEPCHMPCDGKLLLSYDVPYRDGAHALFDAAKLGGLPVYVVTVGGVYLRRAESSR